MLSIAITGANGQLGQSLRAIAPLFPNLDLKFFNRSELDVTNRKSIQEAFGSKHFDYLINCAAYTNVVGAESNSEAANLLNGLAAGYLAEAAQKNKTHLVQISTDYVFDGTKLEPYVPTDLTNPLSVYGQSKLLGEQLVAQNCDRYSVIRTSWVYSEFGSNFYTKIKTRADEGQILWITDEYIGCPTYAPKLAQHILSGITKGDLPQGVSHFAGKEVMTWFGLARKLLPEADIRVAPKEKQPLSVNRPKYSALAV